MTVPMSEQRKIMRHALSLARKYLGYTWPNPTVGAVVVKEGRYVAEASHRGPGKTHAEAAALKKAGRKARDAELYVTLEPCRHQGRTPPCTDTIIKAGISRVVILNRDPHPEGGGGAEVLKEAGIEVVFRCDLPEAREAARMNSPFFKSVQQAYPFVTAKWALSADGIMSKPGQSIWWTGKKSRRYVHRLRKWADAVMVGVGTILADNPRLDCRSSYPKKHPLKVIMDTRLWTPYTAEVLKSPGEVLFFYDSDLDSLNRKLLHDRGAGMRKIPTSGNGGLSVRTALSNLFRLDIRHVLVEGGPRLQSGFIRRGLVDEIIVFNSPKIAGNGITPLEFVEKDAPIEMYHESTEKAGEDTVMRYLIGADPKTGLFPWEEPVLCSPGSSKKSKK